jgi:CubicO group peptidase (beta-lactamase class C family)
MSSGIYWNGGVHYHCPLMEQMRRSKDWVDYIADAPMADPPGRKFVYKEWDVILLSALIGKACGGRVWDITGECLYKPLGITGEPWPVTDCGINYNVMPGEERTDLSARDTAKFGLLVLGKGENRGQRIVSGEYIKTSVQPSAANPGYGYLWWLTENGFHGRGFGGQELNIYPDKKTVAVVQASVTPSSKSYGDICEKIMAFNEKD